VAQQAQPTDSGSMSTFDDLLRALVAGAKAFTVSAEASLAMTTIDVAPEPPDSPATLLLKNEVAKQMRVAPGTIDRYIAQGMPFEHFGSSKRFRLTDCTAWAKARPVRTPVHSLTHGVRRIVRKGGQSVASKNGNSST
jgi:hypothetical protein